MTEKMSSEEVRVLVDQYFGMSGGQLNGFGSHEGLENFIASDCNLPDTDFGKHEGTMRRKLLSIIDDASPRQQAMIIRGALRRQCDRTAWAIEEPERERLERLEERLESIAERLESGTVPTPTLSSTSEIVKDTLRHANTLIRNDGPNAAVDRMHTAFHGHLKHICQRDGIAITKTDPSITDLWKSLLESHPKLQDTSPHREHVKTAVKSLSAVVSSLNTVRNRGTYSHPNTNILGEPEAWLFVDATTTLLGYLGRKLDDS